MSHKCEHCEYISDKPYNLKRHVQRQHNQVLQEHNQEVQEAPDAPKKSAGRGRPRKQTTPQVNPAMNSVPPHPSPPPQPPQEMHRRGRVCGDPNCDQDHDGDFDITEPQYVDEEKQLCRVYVYHIIKNPEADDLIVRKRAHIVPVAAHRPPLVFYEREALEFMELHMHDEKEGGDEGSDEATEPDAP